jgi:shikimate dehydrogenase
VPVEPREPVARLAVLGSPISHSKSPALHAAAYRVLGLPWNYERVELTGATLPGFLRDLGDEWRGLSVTMPLKHDVLPLLDETDELVEITGVCNTVLLSNGRRVGFNTDVHGITTAFTETGITSLDHVQVLGGGATASSAIVAAARLGASRVTVSVRSPEKSTGLLHLGSALGIQLEIGHLGDILLEHPTAIISTLPNRVEADLVFDTASRHESILFDVAYEPWPTNLAQRWLEANGTVISGLGMLLHQALMQVRIFSTGLPDQPLHDEPAVLAAMRSSIGLSGS